MAEHGLLHGTGEAMSDMELYEALQELAQLREELEHERSRFRQAIQRAQEAEKALQAMYEERRKEAGN